ncbi:hypothetical protein BC834DRAFT_143817 [Gloeopeniophorella convolvens]|nr:hypothetical protein BC834DRAFT_143817 [Gloeopeniophorella convolvens]
MDSAYDGPRLVSLSSNPTELDHGVCSRAISLPTTCYSKSSSSTSKLARMIMRMNITLNICGSLSHKFRASGGTSFCVFLELCACASNGILSTMTAVTHQRRSPVSCIPLHIEFSSGPEVDVELFRSVVQYLPHAHKFPSTRTPQSMPAHPGDGQPAPNLESLSICLANTSQFGRKRQAKLLSQKTSWEVPHRCCVILTCGVYHPAQLFPCSHRTPITSHLCVRSCLK